MRMFHIEQVKMCVMDDADIVNSSRLVQENLTRHLDNSRLIFASDRSLPYIPHCKLIRYRCDLNVSQFSLKCANVAEKFDAILCIFKCIQNENASAIIFVNVCIEFQTI